MRLIQYLSFIFGVLNYGYSQNLENSNHHFSAIKLGCKIDLDSNLNSALSFSKKNSENLLLTNATIKKFTFDSEKLNKKLFSNFKIIENTFTSPSRYLRGCGPLQYGVTVPVNSGDLILSMVIDNFVNNILFDGRGPLTRLFSPKN